MTSLHANPYDQRLLRVLGFSLALHAAAVALVEAPEPAFPELPEALELVLATPPSQPAPSVAKAEPVSKPVPTPVPPRPNPAPQSSAPAPAATPSPAIATAPTPVMTSSAPATSSVASVPAPVRESTAAAVAVPQLVDTRYYEARELDTLPGGLRGKPDYPDQANEQEVGGRVELRLQIEADGEISRVEVYSVKPAGVFGELFKKAALDWIRGKKMKPATRAGKAVRASLIVPVVFAPEPQD